MSTYIQFTRTSNLWRMKRLANSKNGNPRYQLTFANDVEGKTKPDAGWVYAVSEHWLNQPVTFKYHFTPTGRCVIDDALLGTYKENDQ
ncbi:MAG: hypothetical protein R6V30_02235 [Paracoccaceae bacterium]